MSPPIGGRPQHGGVGAREAVAPDDQQQAGDRHDRVDELPRPEPDPRDRAFAKGGGERAREMDAEEHDEADDEHEHGAGSGTRCEVSGRCPLDPTGRS